MAQNKKKKVASKKKPAAAKAKKPTSSKPIKTSMEAKKAAAKVMKLVKTANSPDWADFITPLDDRVLVEVETMTKTAGGLFIPATVSDRPQQGKVVAVGRGHRNKKGRVRPMDVSLGDTVMFAAFSGTEMKLENSEILILRESDILGIID